MCGWGSGEGGEADALQWGAALTAPADDPEQVGPRARR